MVAALIDLISELSAGSMNEFLARESFWADAILCDAMCCAILAISIRFFSISLYLSSRDPPGSSSDSNGRCRL
jgi:hypothetical protein